MPKCLECGFEAARLQWTHFRYKCNGKFKNGTEYRAAHPGAVLVDPALAKKTAVTLGNLIRKYGEEKGTTAWNQYKEKQAESNTYTYKHEKYGWTRKQFAEYNKSRAVTLENMISRHGDHDGAIKWMEYCERQAYTNTLSYFIEKYGDEIGREVYDSVCSRKSHSMDAVMARHKCSPPEAADILATYGNKLKFTSNVEIKFVMDIEETLTHSVDYSTLNKQYCVWANNKANFYDIVHNNKAIEFNGDYWHCNPDMYQPAFYHKQVQLLAKDIWGKDQLKLAALREKRNIETLVIWESEYLKDPKETIKRSIQWLTQKDK